MIKRVSEAEKKPNPLVMQNLGHSRWSSYLKMFSLCLFRDFKSVVVLFSFMASHACSSLNSFTWAGGGNFNTWAGQTCDKYREIMSTSSLPVGWIPMYWPHLTNFCHIVVSLYCPTRQLWAMITHIVLLWALDKLLNHMKQSINRIK